MLKSLIITAAGLSGLAGGLGVAALFVPTVAALLKSVFDFLKSPLGTLIGVLALVALLYVAGWVGGDVHGANAVRVAWRADVAAQAKQAAEREQALRDEMKEIADRVLTYDGKLGNQIDQEVKSYVSKTPDVLCRRATDSDVRRLLSIQ